MSEVLDALLDVLEQSRLKNFQTFRTVRDSLTVKKHPYFVDKTRLKRFSVYKRDQNIDKNEHKVQD